MAANVQAADDFAGREFVMTRAFEATREAVFKAWTDPKQLAQWWGPKGFTNPVCEWDARPGGKIYDVMRAPNGVDYPMGGEFRAIVAPERVVFMCGPVDDKGNFLFQFLHTAAFIERNGQTEMTLRSRVINTTPEAKKYIAGFETGMSLSLDRLAETLASKGGPLVIERVYDAPAALVWQAFTNRDKISLWSFKMAEFRPEVGFEFEFYGEKNGVKYFHHCKIMEVIPEKKLAYTWRYLGHEGDSLVTFELFAEGAKTRLKLTHAGLETFPQTADFARGNFLEGWTHILGSSLKEFLEKKQ